VSRSSALLFDLNVDVFFPPFLCADVLGLAQTPYVCHVLRLNEFQYACLFFLFPDLPLSNALLLDLVSLLLLLQSLFFIGSFVAYSYVLCFTGIW
jgi:hypothetical protein